LSAIDGVTVTGYVEDIREFYWMADICVIPLRIARGMQNKVLEAMAAGNAVVATSNASDGIVCSNNVDIVIADDEQAFADRVIELLGNEDARKELGRKAAQNIRARYSWEDNLKAFDELLK
jgi:glycosyltransferase involved in cell wall biosynthesis